MLTFKTGARDTFTDAVLISDDRYLAAGLLACITSLRWLRGEEAINYIADCGKGPYLVIIDVRTPGLAPLRIQTRWRANDCVVRLFPRRVESSLRTDSPDIGADMGLAVGDLLAVLSRAVVQRYSATPMDCSSGPAPLSARETTVFTLLLAGKRVSQIARYMGLSVKSIYGHRCRVVKRYGFKTYCHLYHSLFAGQLLQPPAVLPGARAETDNPAPAQRAEVSKPASPVAVRARKRNRNGHIERI